MLATMSDDLDLADWRRRVFSLYAEARSVPADAEASLASFREAKDRLFASHPSSPLPLPQRTSFEGLVYWPFDPALRFNVPVETDPATADAALPASSEGAPAATRIGWLTMPHEMGSIRLSLYRLAGYGGGLFLPFRDATSGNETYGGGRYLLDTVKGADLGGSGQTLIVDFNYAYHPSCAYDPTWSCPLAPSENWLSLPIRAGERLRPAAG